VLSSCDVGRTVVRPGEEILGFTAALLYTGTATVTASVTRVGDEAAVGTMTAYHRLLATGTRPAEALAAATASDRLSPFVCFGGGSGTAEYASSASRLLLRPTTSMMASRKASSRSRSVAPGPSGGGPAVTASSSAWARSTMRAYISPVRLPNRWKTVPLPTPA